VGYPDEWCNGHDVMLDNEVLVAVRRAQVETSGRKKNETGATGAEAMVLRPPGYGQESWYEHAVGRPCM